MSGDLTGLCLYMQRAANEHNSLTTSLTRDSQTTINIKGHLLHDAIKLLRNILSILQVSNLLTSYLQSKNDN